ncbi:MAG TPA: tol-pal system protein YbgF [Steroidobacteraceae bacterium]|jgi:tol-pal system protein YbgF|nr:tol-pal system protein YbgF [Steroidobacteraceae bacterium]
MRSLTLAVLCLALGACATTPEEDPVQVKLKELDTRETRLERIAANQVDMAQRLDQVQASQRELRGRIEELEHSHDALVKQQRDLYGDLDKRLAAGGAAAGSAAAGATVAGGSSGTAAAAASPTGTAAATPPVGAAPSSVEQAVYNQAFDALKAGSYSVAIAGFKDFIAHYPASPLAENAQYWLGEAYYVNHDYDPAASAFRTVLKKWPDSRKAPDALLKLGFTQYAQAQYAAARATLTDVTRRFPGTDAAKLATERLRKIPGQPTG